MDFTKEKCVVCEKYFGEDDDIVVCPVCGSPYHRECYNEKGKCINEPLHKEGFVYKKADEVNKKSEHKGDVKNPFENIKDGKNNENTDESKKSDDEPTLEGQVFQMALIDALAPDHLDNIDVKIDKRPATLFVAAVNKKSEYYIPRFLAMEQSGKKSMFNFTAFLFPLGWTLYRKIYKLSVAIFAFYLVLFGITLMPAFLNENYNAAYEELIEAEGSEGLYNILEYEAGARDSLTPEEGKLYDVIEDSALPTGVTLIISLSSIALRFIVGGLATGIYFEKTKELVSKTAPEVFDYDKWRSKYVGELMKKGKPLPLIVAALGAFLDVMLLL